MRGEVSATPPDCRAAPRSRAQVPLQGNEDQETPDAAVTMKELRMLRKVRTPEKMPESQDASTNHKKAEELGGARSGAK
ncbi:hypothetical protein NDU88_002024 [Pleurodeles waltl]|uniref:Uncharacterized protein n=1 Tax=Pleurodeles waltl TaxID=8319 RepID=A0AAV7M178_PLEWA|nr:hypothetical protein NDU88_002024 [Pleurodeles waltl]